MGEARRIIGYRVPGSLQIVVAGQAAVVLLRWYAWT
jgi:hypothetical protein